MRIFVGITSYNTREYLQHCLRTMFRQQTKPSRVHIVDNCSSDGTQEFVSCLAEVNSTITCEFCDNNTMAAGGARRAADRFLDEGGCDIFLHLDADTEMRGDALGSVVHQMAGQDGMAIGVRVDKLPYGHPKSRSLRAFDKYIFGEWRQKHAPLLDDAAFSQRMLRKCETGAVYRELCGWFLAMPLPLLRRIGSVDDERFGMWRWESEWVLRASALGCDIEHAEAVSKGLIHHFGGRSRRRAKSPERYGRIAKGDLG